MRASYFFMQNKNRFKILNSSTLFRAQKMGKTVPKDCVWDKYEFSCGNNDVSSPATVFWTKHWTSLVAKYNFIQVQKRFSLKSIQNVTARATCFYHHVQKAPEWNPSTEEFWTAKKLSIGTEICNKADNAGPSNRVGSAFIWENSGSVVLVIRFNEQL